MTIWELHSIHKEYPINALCRLGRINKSSYYKWAGHKSSINDDLNDYLADEIIQLHSQHPDMGYRRMRDVIAHDKNICVNDKRVLRICRRKHIRSVLKDRYNCCTRSAVDPANVADNILNCEFHADMPNQKWVTDVTSFKYGTTLANVRKLYLSAILDLCDHRPAAYVLSDHDDNAIVFNTLDAALENNPGVQPLLHSDRGYQYTSKPFHVKLINAGIKQSMSRVGHCTDNGPMEGFWGIIKREMYYGKKFRTKEELEIAIRQYMDYYTKSRPQRGLGILTPQEYHNKISPAV